MPRSYTTQNSVAPPHARNSSCPCSTTHILSASHGNDKVACIMPGTVPAAFLPTVAFKATDFCQLLKDAIALPDVLLAAAAAPNGRGHFRRDISNASHALACGWVDCLDAFRPARPPQF
eukprot:351563-Chlamydomonas_euryale.AAC.4